MQKTLSGVQESIISLASAVKPVISDRIKQDIFLAFQTGNCLLLHESSAESSALLSFSNKQPPVFNCNSKISSVYLSWFVTLLETMKGAFLGTGLIFEPPYEKTGFLHM